MQVEVNKNELAGAMSMKDEGISYYSTGLMASRPCSSLMPAPARFPAKSDYPVAVTNT